MGLAPTGQPTSNPQVFPDSPLTLREESVYLDERISGRAATLSWGVAEAAGLLALGILGSGVSSPTAQPASRRWR